MRATVFQEFGDLFPANIPAVLGTDDVDDFVDGMFPKKLQDPEFTGFPSNCSDKSKHCH
jgi:hypothetical protein